MTAPVAVLFVSTSPIHPAYPGGFAARHHDFVAAVAAEHDTSIRFLTSSPREHEDFPCQLPVASTVVVPGRTTRRQDLRLPRQSVARATRVRADEAELVVALLPNVAHVVVDRGHAVCVLEEGSERALDTAPTVSVVHRAAEQWRYRTLYRRIGRRRLPVVAISAREAGHFGRWIPPDLVHVVPYGIDTDRYRPRPDVVQDIDVLVPGALNRPEQLVEELVLALRADPSTRRVTCTAAGAGSRDRLLAMRTDLTVVPGYAPDLRDLIARSRVVAIPTFTDVGIKTTMLQAWAMERPVVTSAPVLEATPPGRPSELSTAAASVEQMASQIGALLGAPARCADIGRAGRRFVIAHHDRTAGATAFAELITTELGRIRDGRGARPVRCR